MPVSLFDSLFAGSRDALASIHGETVQFKGRADSEPRTIRTLACRLNGVFEQQQFGVEGTVDTLAVGALKDEALGIPETIRMKDGHRLYYDDVDRPFTWNGEKQNERPDEWTLVFTRQRQETQKARA